MREIRITDITMQKISDSHHQKNIELSFREKLELAKLLDRLNVSVIEIEGISGDLNQPAAKVDKLRIKSIASAVHHSSIAVPVALCADLSEMQANATAVWESIKAAVHPRLQIKVPVSPVQIEYLTGIKAKAMLPVVKSMLDFCLNLTNEVELAAEDATRADYSLLCQVIETALDAGVSVITICDAAGAMLPDEFMAFIQKLQHDIPGLANVCLGISCSNTLAMADACAIAAVSCGAEEIKTAAYSDGLIIDTVSLANMARLLDVKAGQFQIHSDIRITEMNRILGQISRLFETGRAAGGVHALMESALDDGDVLTAKDDMETVLAATNQLGYDLSPEDGLKVFEAFTRAVAKKKELSTRELDAIVASAALQVPQTYTIDHYVINAGNTITTTAHMKLNKRTLDSNGVLSENAETIESVCLGDGPIDASFLAIEQIAGTHYELDDFQIQSVTRGREAMGEAVVKLRAEGKVFSGRGISTDIIQASVDAYISALNKIVYENAGA